MRKDSYILLGLAAVLLFARKTAAPVGRVRRNIFAEIQELQDQDILLNQNYNDLSYHDRVAVMNLASRVGYKQPAASMRSGKNFPEAYYDSLRRQYLKLVNPAIGRIQYPHETYQVRNSRGDVVLTYNDYDPERDMSAALDWFDEGLYGDPYRRTVAAIAKGHKFLWKGKKSGGQLLSRGLADELFFSKTNLDGERKLYKALISKDGWTVDKFVEQHLADMDGAKDAALQALREFPTPKAAKEYILDQYYKSLDDGTPDYVPEDLPF